MRLFHLLLVLSLYFLISCERKTSPPENPPQLLPAISTGESSNSRQNEPISEPVSAPEFSQTPKPLSINSLVPAPNATVSPDTLILLNFDQPLDSKNLNAESFALADSEGTQISLRLSTRGNSLTLTPNSALAHDTSYTVSLLKPLRGQNGEMLSELRWNFLTSPPPLMRPPSVVLVNPTDGETQVQADQSINVYLSQPLDPQTVSKESVRIQAIQGASNFPVEGNLQVEGTSLKFIPNQPWLYGMTYRVTLLPELKDLQGNRLEARYEWSFETRTLAPGMVPIWPGSFMMGSPGKPPERQVTMNQIYYILNHEVTVGEYRLCMEAGACRYSEPTESRHWTMKNPDRVDAPLNYISWDQAQEYTRWLSHQYPGDYRLCSEAEWEYAARAEGQGRFGCGTEAKCLNQHAWHSRNLSQPGPQPVQRKQPNTWGLFDMQGNLWEWVQDYYAPLVPETVTRPSGPKEGRLRTVRGGSYRNQPESLELWQRGGNPPEMRQDYLGFRVCADP